MVVFAVEIEQDEKAIKEINTINKRIQAKGQQNMFISGNTYVYCKDFKWYGVFNLKFLIGPFIPILGAIFLLFPAYFFGGLRLTPWLIPSTVFFLISLLWTRRFIYFLLKLGLRKAKYKGTTRLLSNSEILELLVKSY